MDIAQTLKALIDGINAADWNDVEPLLDRDVVLDDPGGRRHLGSAAFRTALAQWRRTVEDLTFSDVVIMANEGESRGSAEFVLHGRHGSERVSVPAGAFFDVEGAQVNRMTMRLDPADAGLFS